MGWTQGIFGALLVAVLLFVSVFYAWRQARALAGLRRRPDLPADESEHQRRQAWRRLVGSGLLLLLAGLLAGALVYLEAPAQRLADLDVPDTSAYTPEQRAFLRLYGGWWITLLLVLLAVILLAGLDLWATYRWGVRQHRKLQADRRAMVERQVARLREGRDGDG